MQKSNTIQVRRIRRVDVADVIVMVAELAEFEEFYDEPKLLADDVVQACALDSVDSSASADMIILVAEDIETGTLAGYTILFPGYSARSGSILLMENMFVRAKYRAAGVGRTLFTALAEFARNNGYAHEENHVLEWNKPAVNYYARMGTMDLTTAENWRFYRRHL